MDCNSINQKLDSVIDKLQVIDIGSLNSGTKQSKLNLIQVKLSFLKQLVEVKMEEIQEHTNPWNELMTVDDIKPDISF